MNYWTSDLHLGHQGILQHAPIRAARFANVDEMDEYLIHRINQFVQPKDTLWILGDFAWKASKYGHYRQRIKCREINVVRGNHDSSSLRNHVSSLRDMVVRNFNAVRFQMCHYPMHSWSGKEYGSIHLYGHCHGSIETRMDDLYPGRKSMDVGVDAIYRLYEDWIPISLDQIMEKLCSR